MECTDQSETVIIDLEAELEKERANMESRLTDFHKALADEIKKMKVDFNKQISESIEKSEKRMTQTIQEHMGKMMHTSDEAILQIENKANEVTDRLLQIMTNDKTPANEVTSPPRKQLRQHTEDVEMNEGEKPTIAPITPASHKRPIQRGTAESAGEHQ
jgi:hypothetical protein